MRGADDDQQAMFSYVSLESRVPEDHRLRSTRRVTIEILPGLSSIASTVSVERAPRGWNQGGILS